ncbi:MAG: SIMPL domain-containing protein [Bacteroidetes bacterium]|uniref:SIMPL domain-containing protein n=1 Tax=Candidatus Cryptobacteroides merdigallinarum TaxID=2840770 RepID=A0A9D9ENP3_9BACT|nr:SIMPL domain-containing protein [Candidatus Cryptobacteroides merdigallinarum]
MKNNNFLAVCLLTGLVILGAMIPVAVSKFRAYDRTVNVKGLSEMEVKADKVIWPIPFTVVGNDLNAVYSQIDRNTKEIMEFLTSGGISADEISVSLPTISDKYAQEYGNNDRTYRYFTKSVVTVCTGNVDTVLALMPKQSELLKKGIVGTGNSWDGQVQFQFEGLNGIKPGMIEDATKNAREAADKFAKDSGSRLGKIKTANQGTFTISDRDSNTPYIKKVRVVTTVTYYLKN